MINYVGAPVLTLEPKLHHKKATCSFTCGKKIRPNVGIRLGKGVHSKAMGSLSTPKVKCIFCRIGSLQLSAALAWMPILDFFVHDAKVSTVKQWRAGARLK